MPGKSHGRRSLVGYSPWGCTESDTTERPHACVHTTKSETYLQHRESCGKFSCKFYHNTHHHHHCLRCNKGAKSWLLTAIPRSWHRAVSLVSSSLLLLGTRGKTQTLPCTPPSPAQKHPSLLPITPCPRRFLMSAAAAQSLSCVRLFVTPWTVAH